MMVREAFIYFFVGFLHLLEDLSFWAPVMIVIAVVGGAITLAQTIWKKIKRS
jgi:hypothetical protein